MHGFCKSKSEKISWDPSEGMVMCAKNADGSEVQLMKPPKGSKVGERIQLEGNPIFDEPLP